MDPKPETPHPTPLSYSSTLDLAAAARLLRDTATSPDRPIVLFTHAKPDGDAWGSVIALTAALRGLGKDTFACFLAPIPDALSKLPGADLAVTFGDKESLPKDASLFVILDTGAWVQVGKDVRELVEPHLERTLLIDHHLSGDIEAAHRHVDRTAAATAELVTELLDHLGTLPPKQSAQLPPPSEGEGRGGGGTSGEADARSSKASDVLHRIIAPALYVGVASDTGWFRFSNATARTHRIAARLLDLGVDHAALYGELEQCERIEKLRLLTRALQSLQLIADGHAAIMTLRLTDFADTGATEAETERLIDAPQMVGDVQVVVLVTERKNKDSTLTSVSFRSKHVPEWKGGEAKAVNVQKLAAEFNGGGHARAAGAKIDAPVDEVLPRLRAALERVVAGTRK